MCFAGQAMKQIWRGQQNERWGWDWPLECQILTVSARGLSLYVRIWRLNVRFWRIKTVPALKELKYFHNIGIRMKRKEVTKTFTMISNLKKLVFEVYQCLYKSIFVLQGLTWIIVMSWCETVDPECRKREWLLRFPMSINDHACLICMLWKSPQFSVNNPRDLIWFRNDQLKCPGFTPYINNTVKLCVEIPKWY